MRVVSLPESFQFSFRITGIPDDHMVKEFAVNGPNQSLDDEGIDVRMIAARGRHHRAASMAFTD
jgi:hypothetical protein